ncbi:MAG: hypothetical protein AB7U34_07065, partial [Novosphingobium sp.]
MEVIAFQAIIFASIAMTRLIFPQKLLAVCLAWTAFTLLLVFATPLIVLQLATIWGSYSLFNPDQDNSSSASSRDSRELRPSPSAVAIPQPGPHNAKIALPARKGETSTRQAGLNTGTKKVFADAVRFVTVASEVQKATMEIDKAISSERIYLEHILQSAEADIKVEDFKSQSEDHRQAYEKNYAIFSKILNDAKSTAEVKPEFPPLPDFNSVARHTDPEIATAIANKINQMRENRDQCLSDMAQRLSQDSRLLQKF